MKIVRKVQNRMAIMILIYGKPVSRKNVANILSLSGVGYGGGGCRKIKSSLTILNTNIALKNIIYKISLL